MELKFYLAVIRRWGWVLVVTTVLAGAAGYLYASRQPSVFETSTRMLVGPAIQNPDVDSDALRASGQIGQIYAELASSRPVVQSVISSLGLNLDVDRAVKQVSAAWSESNQILTITVQAGDAVTATRLANAIGDVLIERSPAGPSSVQAQRRAEATAEIERLKEAMTATQSTIDRLNTEIQQATDSVLQRNIIVQLDQQRAQLVASQQALNEQYALLQNSSANQIAALEPAVSANQIAPNYPISIAASLIAGLVLGLGLMLLGAYFHDVVYTPDELRAATGLPYLGGLARHTLLRRASPSPLVVQAQPETMAAETFRILRTNLQVPGLLDPGSSLLITSPSGGDGKTEVAANLAVSFAQAGKSVILIDANLRRPSLAALFGLEQQADLSHLTDESQTLPRPQPIRTVPGLAVLAVQASQHSSSEILASARMYELLQSCKAQADVVILDSAPLLYSDALALAPQADAVLLVVKSGQTKRQITISAVESLRLVGANLIGVVLNRVAPGPAYNYYPQHAPTRARPAFMAAAQGDGSGDTGATIQLHAIAPPPPHMRNGANGQRVGEEGDGMLGQVFGEYSELFRRVTGTPGDGRDGDPGAVK